MLPEQNGPPSTPAISGDAAPVACRERTDGSARNWPSTGTPFPAKRRDDAVSHAGRTRALRLREQLLRPLKPYHSGNRGRPPPRSVRDMKCMEPYRLVRAGFLNESDRNLPKMSADGRESGTATPI